MKHLTIFLIGLFLLNVLAFSDDRNPSQYEARYYENAKVVRVKYAQGEAYVKRSYDEGLEEASVNLPLFEKDKIGTTSGRLELYLGRSNYMRLDYDSEIILTKAPVMRKTNMAIRVLKGGVYLDFQNLDFEKDTELQTQDCGVFLLDRGIYRINVLPDGRTEIFVYEGMAEVAGDQDAQTVRAKQKVVMADGKLVERPFYFYASDKDDFDTWNAQRNQDIGYARQSASRYLQSGYEDQEYELSRNGRWEYETSISNYVWIPYNVSANWRPYWHGRWVWNPYYGHVWSSYDSWGWYTHGYGRWGWSSGWGWYWSPGYRWSPGWVHWFWDSSYWGWCPMNYWNRPCVVLHGRGYHGWGRKKPIPYHSRSNTIIRKNQLSAGNIRNVALKRGAMDRMSHKSLAYKGRGPIGRPNYAKTNVINAQGRSVMYKKSGIVSSGKYRANPSTVGKRSAVEANTLRYSGKQSNRGRTFKYSTAKSGAKTYSSTARAYRSYKTPSAQGRSSSRTQAFKSYGSKSTASRGSKSASGRTYKSTSRSSKSRSRSTTSRSGSKSSKAKRKKGEPGYSSRYQSQNSRRYTASGSASGQSQRSTKRYQSRTQGQKTAGSYSSQQSRNNRSSYRTYRSRSGGSTGAAASRSGSYRTPTRSSRSYQRSRGSYNNQTNSRGGSYRGSSSRSYSRSSRSYSRSSRSSGRSSRGSARSSSSRGSSSRGSSSRGSSSRGSSSRGSGGRKRG